MELLICALISAAFGAIPVIAGILPETFLVFTLAPIVLAFLFGEYILPKLIHLSPELYELNNRVSDALPSIFYGQDRLPDNWRVFVSLDDSRVITAVGSHTLIVTKGCYNMRPEEFHFALQEAIEQRRNHRSTALLIATVGNPIFFYFRLFCRIGRILTRIVFFPLSLIISAVATHDSDSMRDSFRTGQRVGGFVATISDKIYSVIAILFIKISNLTLLLYSPVIGKMDAAIDQQLAALNLRRVMENVIMENAGIPYTGGVPRENCIIYRTAPQKRIELLENPQPQPQLQRAPQPQPQPQQQRAPQPQPQPQQQRRPHQPQSAHQSTPQQHTRPRHTMRILPPDSSGGNVQSPQRDAGTGSSSQGEDRPRHRIRIIP